MIPVTVISLFSAVAPLLLQAAAAPRMTARDMFYAAESSATARPALALGLRYAVQRKLLNGQWLDVAPDSVFHSGDHIRVTVTANAAGYLYIIQQGSSGAWTPLYPPAGDSIPVPRVETGKSLTIPEEGSFLFNDQPGTEALFLLFSTQPLSSLSEERQASRGSLDDTSVSAIRKVYSRDLIVESLDEARAQSLQDHGVYVVNAQSGPARNMVVVDLKLQHSK